MFLPIGDDIHKRHFPYVTVTLIVVNVLIFALEANVLYQPIDEADPEIYFESVTDMFTTWGLVPARDIHPDVGNPMSHIGIFTHMFLHGGFMHLLGNMIVLWAFGYSLEGSYGSRALLSLYLIWGACAAIGHVLSNTAEEMPMIGASGAIAGLIGAYTLTFGYNTNIKTMFLIGLRPVFVDIPASIFGSIWILLQIANASMGDVGVAWFAHIGGFAGGFATMAFLRKRTKAVLIERRGVMQLCDREELDAVGEDEMVDQGPKEVPTCCPHCDTELSDENRITDTLARCPNADCCRMLDLADLQLAGAGA